MSDALIRDESLLRKLTQALLPLAGALGVFAFIVLFDVLADTRNLGPLSAVYEFRHGDKLGHFALFGLLTLLIDLSVLRLFPNENRGYLLVTTSLLLMTLMLVSELSQALFPARTVDVFDLLWGYAGVISAGALMQLRASRHI